MRPSILRSDQLLVDTRTGARMLGLADRTFRAYVAAGHLEKVHLGARVVRYRVADLRAIAAPNPSVWPDRAAKPSPASPAGEVARRGARPPGVASGRRAMG